MKTTTLPEHPKATKRKPVNQRWYYEPVETSALMVQSNVTEDEMKQRGALEGQPQVSFEKTAVDGPID